MVNLLKIETRIAWHEIKDNILHIILHNYVEIELEDIKESIAARERMQGGNSMLVFVDTTGLGGISNEARTYAALEKYTVMNKALALLTPSLPTKIIVNFYINFDKPNAPTKMFKSKEKALEWLESIR